MKETFKISDHLIYFQLPSHISTKNHQVIFQVVRSILFKACDVEYNEQTVTLAFCAGISTLFRN